MTTVLLALLIALITMFLPEGVVEVEAPDEACLSTDAQFTRTMFAGDPSTLLLLDLIKTVSGLLLLDSPISPFTEFCDVLGGCSTHLHKAIVDLAADHMPYTRAQYWKSPDRTKVVNYKPCTLHTKV